MLFLPRVVMTDAVAFLVGCRRRGLEFSVCPATGALLAAPRHLIDPDLAAAIRDRKDALVAALRAEALPPAAPLTWPAELERLAAFLAAVEWPAVPFLVNRATLVTDPVVARAAMLAQAAANPTGQCRRAVLARLRQLRRLAANGWKLTE